MSNREVVRRLRGDLRAAQRIIYGTKVCLDVFAGAGKVGKYWEGLGGAAVSIEWTNCPWHDVSKRAVRRELLRWVRLNKSQPS